MPTPDMILSGLTVIANEWRWLATAWHGTVLAILIHALLKRPFQRTLAMLITLPAISVGALAGWSGNPFNGAAFLSLALVMAFAATRMERRAVAVGPWSRAATGSVLFAFGFVYPHFLVTNTWASIFIRRPSD